MKKPSKARRALNGATRGVVTSVRLALLYALLAGAQTAVYTHSQRHQNQAVQLLRASGYDHLG